MKYLGNNEYKCEHCGNTLVIITKEDVKYCPVCGKDNDLPKKTFKLVGSV